MNLDDYASFAQLDSQNLIAEIEALPDQLTAAWAVGQTLVLPVWRDIRQVLVVALGTSALAADMLAAYIAPNCARPVAVVRNYTLPAWASGPESLVICASYSGDTEEISNAFGQAVSRNCRVLVVTTGGKLATAARKAAAGLWIYEAQTHTRETVAYTFGLLLAIFARLNLILDPAKDLAEAVAALKGQQASLGVESPITQNEAKRLAGQCVGRWLAIFGADHLEPVGRYWKEQVNKIAKTWAQAEVLPEADHSTLPGVVQPGAMMGQTMLIFLRSRGCHPRNQLRVEATKEYFMLEGLGTDFFAASGESPLAQMWTTLHFGAYFAYYLAMAYEVDPDPQTTVEAFKIFLAESAP